MKKMAVLIGLMFISATSFAQKRSDLQGPAYKNYKPWQHDAPVETVYTSNSKAGLMGPEYKNYKPWKKRSNVEYKEVVFVNKKAKLTGPKYKNYKHWRKKSAETTSQ